MHLNEIWDTDLVSFSFGFDNQLPLAPVTRPKDIPEDHEVDIWVFDL